MFIKRARRRTIDFCFLHSHQLLKQYDLKPDPMLEVLQKYETQNVSFS